MITVRITGGLGNQLFQYAAAKALAVSLGEKVQLDISFYGSAANAQLKREFILNHFKIDAVISSKNTGDLLESNSFFERIKKKLTGHTVQYYFEEKGIAPEKLMALKSPVYLDGVFQSEVFFAGIEKTIRKEFVLKQPMYDPTNLGALKKMDTQHSVGIHVRRGDYVSEEKTNKLHGVCSPAYYKNAMQWFIEKLNQPVFYIFSDDLSWARNQFADVTGAIFVKPAAEREISPDLLEFTYMRRCKHQIIANSSFSWWAAWLNENPEKHVIGPKNWFADPGMNEAYQNILPVDWIKL